MAIKKYKNTRLENFMRFLKFRVLHVNDSPKSIAMGVGLGLLIAWAPILGVHMIMVLFLAIITKANKVVSIAAVWVSNPLTYIPMWSFGYMFGRIILKIFIGGNADQPENITQQVSSFNLSEFFSRFFELTFWKEIGASLWSKGPELWLGSLILGLVSAVVGYFLTYYFITKHREKNPHRRFQKHL
jgi:uncharacterized protein (DUF2062 family)